MALSRITEAVASFTDLTIADDLTLSDDLLLASDANIIKFGTDADVTITHVADTGLLLNSTSVIQFNDASQTIGAPSGTKLDIKAGSEIELTSTLIDIVGNLTVSGTIIGAGALTAATSITVGNAALTEAELELLDGLTAGTAIASKVVTTDANIDSSGMRNLTITGELDAATLDISGAIDVAGTSNLDVVDIDGAVDMASTLQVDGAITGSTTIQGATITATTAFVPDASDGAALGTTALEFSDLFLADGAVIALGDDQDVSLTHVADTGILLSSTDKLMFNDASQFIHAPTATVLDIAATDEIELTATLIDVVGNLAISGDLNLAGDLEVGGSSSVTVSASGAVVPDANDGATLGTAALGFADIFLADGSTIQFGNDEEITLTHVADVGLTLTHVTAGDNLPIVLQLKSQEDAIVANEVIASIEFAAGDSDGTDGATVAAGIHAIAEGTFAADANATKLVFTTGVSETAAASATAKMTLSSAGVLTTAGAITSGGVVTGSAFTAGSAVLAEAELELLDGLTAGTAIASKVVTTDANIDSTGMRNLTISGELDAATLDISGAIDVAGTSNLDVVDIDGAVDMASTLAVAGVVTANAGVVVDTITIDAGQIDQSSGDLTLDVAGDLIIDTDGAEVKLKDGGTLYAKLQNSSGTFLIESSGQDNDIFLKGNDGGSVITALALDMSDAGTAIFNNRVRAALASDGSPSYSFGNDTHTGMFSPANDTIGFSTGGAERSRINPNGTTCFGAANNDSMLGIESNTSSFPSMFINSTTSGTNATVLVRFRRGGTNVGDIRVTGDATAYITSSDYRIKENVTTSWDATTRLKQLKPSRFNFISDADTTVDGFIAHEVSSIVPEAIAGEKDDTEDRADVVLNADGTFNSSGISQADWIVGKSKEKYASDTTWVASKTVPLYQGIDQSKLVPLLVKSLQEALVEIATLKTKVTALEDLSKLPVSYTHLTLPTNREV